MKRRPLVRFQHCECPGAHMWDHGLQRVDEGRPVTHRIAVFSIERQPTKGDAASLTLTVDPGAKSCCLAEPGRRRH